MAETAYANVAEAETARLKAAVADAIEDGVYAARRAVKRGRHAAEEMVDEAVHEVKHHPVQALAAASVLSFTAGVLLGWIAFRGTRR